MTALKMAHSQPRNLRFEPKLYIAAFAQVGMRLEHSNCKLLGYMQLGMTYPSQQAASDSVSAQHEFALAC